MRPKWFWYLVQDDLEKAKPQKEAKLTGGDVRRLRKMMDRKQAELGAKK